MSCNYAGYFFAEYGLNYPILANTNGVNGTSNQNINPLLIEIEGICENTRDGSLMLDIISCGAFTPLGAISLFCGIRRFPSAESNRPVQCKNGPIGDAASMSENGSVKASAARAG